jgi:phosphatidylinositol-3-phosphatase
VSTVFAGPAAKRGYRSQTAYDHYSLLHTIEKGWGLAPLTDNDRNAPTMDDLLR